jgi:hypothetical protein
MKKKLKTLLRVGLLSLFAFCMSGCAMKQSITIHEDGSTDYAMYCLLTDEEVASGKYSTEGGSLEYVGKTTIDGVEYNEYLDTSSSQSSEYKGGVSEDGSSIILPNCFYMDLSSKSSSSENAIDLSDEDVDLGDTSFEILEITMPNAIIETNGTLSDDRKTVYWNQNDYDNVDAWYAYTDNEWKVYLNGIKGKYIKEPTKVTIVSTRPTKSIKVNNKAIKEKVYEVNKEGKYTFKVTSNKGTKTCSLIYDKTKPKTNVESKAYKKKVKIKCSDKLSGIKKITLNGKKIKNGYVVKKKGTYKLKVTDNAGNTKTVKFSIIK